MNGSSRDLGGSSGIGSERSSVASMGDGGRGFVLDTMETMLGAGEETDEDGGKQEKLDGWTTINRADTTDNQTKLTSRIKKAISFSNNVNSRWRSVSVFQNDRRAGVTSVPSLALTNRGEDSRSVEGRAVASSMVWGSGGGEEAIRRCAPMITSVIVTHRVTLDLHMIIPILGSSRAGAFAFADAVLSIRNHFIL